jgi:hypothetical protein
MDKFYTKPEYAKKCIEIVFDKYPIDQWDFIIEPSAGSGSFLCQLPFYPERLYEKIIGIDILPEHSNILSQDFLVYEPPHMHKKILIIGNPPFGKVSSMAIQFFNRSAKWAQVIAFIVPRTFRRVSIQNKLDLNFQLMYDEDVPITPCQFIPCMAAKCCFQIWEKIVNVQPQRTIIEYPTSHPDWTFLPLGPLDEKGQPTPPTDADFAIRAYGGSIGEIKITNLDKLRPKSWHWIKVNNEKIDKEILMERFGKIDFSNSKNTARQNSMGKGEFVYSYIQLVNLILD